MYGLIPYFELDWIAWFQWTLIASSLAKYSLKWVQSWFNFFLQEWWFLRTQVFAAFRHRLATWTCTLVSLKCNRLYRGMRGQFSFLAIWRGPLLWLLWISELHFNLRQLNLIGPIGWFFRFWWVWLMALNQQRYFWFSFLLWDFIFLWGWRFGGIWWGRRFFICLRGGAWWVRTFNNWEGKGGRFRLKVWFFLQGFPIFTFKCWGLKKHRNTAITGFEASARWFRKRWFGINCCWKVTIFWFNWLCFLWPFTSFPPHLRWLPRHIFLHLLRLRFLRPTLW